MDNISEGSGSEEKRSLFDQASPKLTFWFGFFVGAGIITLIGFVFLVIVMFKGVDLTQAKSTTKTTTTNTNSAADVGNTTPPAQPTTIDASKITIDDSDYIRGKADAKVTIVGFSDLECPYCKRFHPELVTAYEANPDDVRWVYKHFPLSFHPEAKPGAVAAECAGKLAGSDTFWAFIDAVYADQSNIGDAQFTKIANNLGLNATDFATCLKSGEFDAKIAADQALGQSIGVGGTPTTFVIVGNTATRLSGAVPQSDVDTAISTALAK